MSHVPWNRPLPPDIHLSGQRRFDPPLADPIHNWIISNGATSFPSLVVRSQVTDRTEEFLIKAEYYEGTLDLSFSGEFPLPPILNHMAWDWLEFHYHPLQRLSVTVTNWVPDPRVICGTHFIQNHGSKTREITLKLGCQGEVGGCRVPISIESFRGRKILSGNSSHRNLVLFMTGDKTISSHGLNQLLATTVLEPAEADEFRWILVYCESGTDANEYLDEIIKLDWNGEISRRKIMLNNQLRVITGNADRDFSLAFSQRQARLILNQFFLHREGNNPSTLSLSPLQAWQLIQALQPLDPASLEQLLREAIRDKDKKESSIPFEAELLWLAQQIGVNPNLLEEFLPIIDGNLSIWFSDERDKDGDGIPEEPAADLYQLNPAHWLHEPYGDKLEGYANTLETPGLAALLYNEIRQFGKLQEKIPGASATLDYMERQRTLKDYILGSWQDDEGRFQTRDYQSHFSQDGFDLSGPIQNGWHHFQSELPIPSRLTITINNTRRTRFPENLLVTLHGLDWQERYRIEELTTRDILWHENGGWGSTLSIFSRLDHCVVVGLETNQNVGIKASRTDKQDLSLLLPILMGCLPPDIKEKIIINSLGEGGSFWSDHGLRSYPQPGSSPVSPALNTLVIQGLIRNGCTELAGEIFQRWLDAASINLNQNGCLYSAWDAIGGVGMGKSNQLESTLPIGLLYELLGISFLGSRDLILEEKQPLFFPVKLIYRGAEIILQESETILQLPGSKETAYPRGKKAVIHL